MSGFSHVWKGQSQALRGLLICSTLVLAGCVLAGCASGLFGAGADPDVLAGDDRAAKPPATGKTNGPGQGSLEDRINQLEEDVAAIRIALSRLGPGVLASQPASMPAVFDAAAPAAPATPPQPRTVPVSPPMPPSGPAAGGGASGATDKFAVHLASYKSAEAARKGWRDIAADHPSLIGVLTPVLSRVDLGSKGVFYRLKAGPFETWDKAEAVCKALLALSWTCAVLDFGGSALGAESAKKDALGLSGP